MLWFLLYPIRGTTQPPRLSANHPIRRAFYRHGKTTAQHWLLAMLVSVAIAMGLSYPTIFLSENPTAGFAAYPHHTWTSTKPFTGDESAIDVEMRQVWIHGDYMNALDKDVLKNGLRIQQTLVGGEKLTSIFPTLNEKLRSSTLTWGYHSPLMYWNNSAVMIEEDGNVIQTINDQSGSSSSLNVALRPASVFAGKRFHRNKLQAADALVLTLMNKAEDNVGGKWSDRMKAIASDPCEDCTLFPHDGDVTRNKVYEFSFTPLSLQENLALTFAYSGMALYVLMSLRRLKAFHSRFGLVVTAITQMTCSILASFTICGILKINLSMVPQNAYPFVVLVVGLENMFRLINAILAYPATMATDKRIANALGDIGPVSVATAVQNVAILAVLAAFVSPGVAAFCAFACIATLFDVFFLLTFFVAVLNVDIRRLELQDALSRSNPQQRRKEKRRHSPSKHIWFDALVQGRLPFSTRMAGTAVTTTFIISLNYHFFERHEKATSLRHLLDMIRGGPPGIHDLDAFTPPPMNATLTPGDWIRMQDFDTAREVMRLAKPGADSFIVRVYAPLVVVLAGADRSGAPLGAEAWTFALRDFAVHHFYPVAVAVVFAVAFVAVLMNFLLYSEDYDDAASSYEEDRVEDESLKVQSVVLPHKLDIMKLSGTSRGHFVTIGLDRSIAVSRFDRAHQEYTTFNLPRDVLSSIQWPIHHVVLDDSADWLACHGADEKIILYNCSTGTLLEKRTQYPDDNPPVIFDFVRLGNGEGLQTYFFVLTSGGRLASQHVGGSEGIAERLSDARLLGATLLDGGSQGKKLLVATEDANVVTYKWSEGKWELFCSQALPVSTLQGRISGPVRISMCLDVGPEVLIVNTTAAVVFMDAQSLTVMSRLEHADQSTNHMLVGPVKRCAACGSVALQAIALVTDSEAAKPCSMVTYMNENSHEGEISPVCVRATTPGCRSFGSCKSTTQDLPSAGAWEVLSSAAIVGLRRQQLPANGQPIPARGSQMRHRRQASRALQEDRWEAYKVSLDGEIETVDVPTGDDALYVNTAGPTTVMDAQTVAVAFGNRVKVIRCSRRGSLANGHTPQRHSSRRLTSRKAQ